MQNTQFQNFAFISYRHTNARWARWLQRKLEAYRLPAAIKKTTPHQTKIRPIFRDKTDLSSGLLKDELRKELERSRFLIVLCSRELAKKSDYVDFEVECFLEMGRSKNIIPFIIDGTPCAQRPEDECFPKALLAMEDAPLGVDLQKDSRRKALIRLIAYLLGVRFDALWQRDLRKQRAKGLMAALAVVALLLGGLWSYDYYVPKVRHYTDYTLRYGIPVGIRELPAAQARKIKSFYTIVTCQNQVRELRCENAYGVITGTAPAYDSERPAWVKYDTYSGNALRVARYFNAYGVPVMTLKYSDFFGENSKTQTVDFYQGFNDSVAQNLASNMAGADVFDPTTLGENRSRIIRNIVTYTDEGFESRVLFASDTRSLTSYAADANGIYGREYEVNALGQRTRVCYLNAKGERTTLPNGVHSQAIEYSGGLATRVSFLDASNQPIRGEEGYALEVLEYNQDFNNIRLSFFDANGALTMSADGYARAEASFQDGLMIRYSVFDTSLTPCYTEGFSTQLVEYENGRFTRIVYLDAEGRCSPRQDGSAEIRVQYDDEGRVVRFESRDAQGNLCYNTYGYAVELSEYDEQGNLVRVQYLDPEGKPCYSKTGECRIELEYRDNRLIATHCLDADGQPAINPYYGYASLLTGYSDDNVSRYTYLDAEGNLCRSKEGYAEIQYEYLDGNLTGIAYFGVDNLPCNYQGIASKQMEYKNGQMIRERYYDVNDAPILCSDGYAQVRYEYDSMGRLTQLGYYDAQDRPLSCRSGYAFLRYEYDETGRVIQEAYFNTSLQPTTNKDSIHGFRYTYNQNGNLLTTRLMSKTSGGLESFGGYTTKVCAYDSRGNLTEQALYIETDEEMWPVNGDQGWSVERRAYDARNQMVSDTYFDRNGAACGDENGIHQYLHEYDARGNRTFTRFRGTDGQPLSPNSAYQAEYDEVGLMICERWYKSDGSVANRKTYEYDARGFCVRIQFWKGEDTPELYEGYHALQQVYDDFGNKVKSEFLGTDDQPVEISGGYAVIMTAYDRYGRPVSEEYLDAEGEPCACSAGYARIEWGYNTLGLCSEERYFDEKGAARSPVACVRWTYGDTYFVTETAYFGPDGHRVVNPETGYAIMRCEWKDNLQVSEAYFDPLGQPIEVDGVARRTCTFDENDSTTEVNFYRSDGSPIPENRAGSRQVEVQSVSPDMPGAHLGVKAGDVFLELGDWRYDVAADSDMAIDMLEAYVKLIHGKTIPVTFLRTLEDGSEQVFSVQFCFGTMGVVIQNRLITDAAHEHLLQILQEQLPQSLDDQKELNQETG